MYNIAYPVSVAVEWTNGLEAAEADAAEEHDEDEEQHNRREDGDWLVRTWNVDNVDKNKII